MHPGNMLSKVTRKVLSALTSRTASLAAATGNGVDISDLEGVIEVHLLTRSISGTSPTWAHEVHTSADDGVADPYVAVAAFTQAAAATHDAVVTIDKAKLKRYVCAVGTIGGSSTPTLVVGGFVRGIKKYP